jgi:hypothetical protein
MKDIGAAYTAPAPRRQTAAGPEQLSWGLLDAASGLQEVNGGQWLHVALTGSGYFRWIGRKIKPLGFHAQRRGTF